MLMGGAGFSCWAVLTGEWQRLDPTAISAISVGACLFNRVWLLIGFAAYTWLLRVAPSGGLDLCVCQYPVVAILLRTPAAEESLTPRILMAAVIIIGSVA
jgi:hypothetical protein